MILVCGYIVFMKTAIPASIPPPKYLLINGANDFEKFKCASTTNKYAVKIFALELLDNFHCNGALWQGWFTAAGADLPVYLSGNYQRIIEWMHKSSAYFHFAFHEISESTSKNIILVMLNGTFHFLNAECSLVSLGVVVAIWCNFTLIYLMRGILPNTTLPPKLSTDAIYEKAQSFHCN